MVEEESMPDGYSGRVAVATKKDEGTSAPFDILPPETGASVFHRWTAVDIAVGVYALATAVLVAVRYHAVADPLSILAFHGIVLLVILALPPRGSTWEMSSSGEPKWKFILRGGARFLRYGYPLLLILFFFEEVEQMIHAVTPQTPYWFEPYLYAADRWLFGELPAVVLSDWVGLVQDEIMHGFYFSYYFIVIGGVVLAYVGAKKLPGPGFDTAITSMIFAYLLAFIWYPWLPARGPWENPELMATLPPFQGFFFKPIIEWIIGQGAQSGGCFPSSHVAGSWGMVFGLARYHRRSAVVFGLVTVGLSISCIYTRYHHAVDVPAGFLMGAIGAWLGWKLTRGGYRT
jgi:membrane-associated phospholipid phosphatase